MKSKRKATENVIRSSEINNEGILYRYSLVENKSRSIPSYGLPLYTLRVEMTEADGSSTEAMARDLFRDMDKALSFYDKIVKNLATPIDLAYVVEDEMR